MKVCPWGVHQPLSRNDHWQRMWSILCVPLSKLLQLGRWWSPEHNCFNNQHQSWANWSNFQGVYIMKSPRAALIDFLQDKITTDCSVYDGNQLVWDETYGTESCKKAVILEDLCTLQWQPVARDTFKSRMHCYLLVDNTQFQVSCWQLNKLKLGQGLYVIY